MASVATAQLSAHEKDELVCSYAALLLQDDGQEITSDAINKIIKASGNTVEAYWPALFAKAIAGTNITEILNNVGSAPAAASAAPTAAPVAEKKEEKPKEEVAEVNLKGGIFDEADDY